MPAVIHSITKRRLHPSVINHKRRHFDSVVIEDDALVDVVAHDSNAFLILVGDTAHSDVEVECLLQMLHHLARSVRSPHFKRNPTYPGAPGREEQIWQIYNMVRMKMREKQFA